MARERLNFRDHWKSYAAVGATVLSVLAIEAAAEKDQMITHGVDRLRATKVGSVAVPFVVISTAAHLLGAVPEKYDWIHQMTKLKRPRK
jgi:hypothetical protein